MHANFYARLVDAQGRTVPGSVRKGHNVFTTVGRETLAKLISWATVDATDVAFTDERVRWGGVGSGSQPEIKAVTGLVAPLAVDNENYIKTVDAGLTTFPNVTTVVHRAIFGARELHPIVVTRIQTKTLSLSNGIGPFVFTWGSAPTEGNILILCSSHFSSRDISSITQVGVTWTKQIDKTESGAGTPSDGVRTAIWAGEVGAGAGAGMSIAVTGFDRPGFVGAEYSGLEPSSPLNLTASASGQSSPVDSGITAVSPGGEIFIGALGLDDADSASLGAPSNGFVEVGSASGSGSSDDDHLIQMSEKLSGVSETANTLAVVTGTFDNQAGVVATFTAVPGPPVVVSEAALYADRDLGGGPLMDPGLGTNLPMFYKTFEGLVKTPAFSLEIVWEQKF